LRFSRKLLSLHRFSPVIPSTHVAFASLGLCGQWSDIETSIPILISAPFWYAWWFWIAFFAVIIFLCVTLFHRRYEALRREARGQEKSSQKLIESYEHEQLQIAAALGDRLVKILATIKNRAAPGLESGDPAEREQLGEISSLASEAISIVDEITHNLRPYQLDRLGLTKAIDSMITHHSESSNITFTVDIDNIDGSFPPQHEINVYRIVQESVNNILRHAWATAAQVLIKKNPTIIHITVQDNGRGLLPHEPPGDRVGTGGYGLIRMKELARLMGGVLTVDSPGSSGTIVTVTIPIKPSQQ